MSSHFVNSTRPISFQVDFPSPFYSIEEVCYTFTFDPASPLDPGEDVTVYSNEFLPYGGSNGGFGSVNVGTYPEYSTTSCLPRSDFSLDDALLDGGLNGTVVMDTGSSLIRSLQVTVTGIPTDFGILVSPSSATVGRGAVAQFLVSVEFTGNFSETVTLGLSPLPTNTAALLQRNSGSSNFTSSLAIDVGITAPRATLYPINITGTSSSRTIRYSTIRLTITDVPVASFTFTPESPRQYQAVSFNASTSYDPDGTIVQWTWDFGDIYGDISCFPCPRVTTGPIVQHTFQNSGNYTAQLTVKDDGGVSSTNSTVIQVGKPFTHDVSVTTLRAFPTVAVQTQQIRIFVFLDNIGLDNETVNVTVYLDGIPIGTRTGFFIPTQSYNPIYTAGEVAVTGNTTNVPLGNHTLSAKVFLSTDEDLSNNSASYGQVKILPPPIITINPPTADTGTEVTVKGSGFPIPQSNSEKSQIYISFDGVALGVAHPENGAFNFTFYPPHADRGVHTIIATESLTQANAKTAFELTTSASNSSQAAWLTQPPDEAAIGVAIAIGALLSYLFVRRRGRQTLKPERSPTPP